MNTRKIIALTIVAAGSTVASLPAAADAEHRAKALEIIKRDFQPRGQAGVDRLAEDGLQAICNRTGNNPPEYIAKRMEADQLATVKLPADGKLLGDWKEGEKIAQSGRGFTWTDNPGLPVGGNCYNCHQISPKELSFGTPDIQKYTYSKIWNAKGFNLCSEMPRFGHVGALNEQQVRHLVALLLDPASPVNK